jgi:hypothetical protein
MTSIAKRRLRDLSVSILNAVERKIVMFDVGSGGELKFPWDLLPAGLIEIIGIDPETDSSSGDIRCISSKSGKALFHIAVDPRASSLHEAKEEFISRFGMDSLRSQQSVMVDCITVDEYLGENINRIDIIDINTEGHDLEVLKGAHKLFSIGMVKLAKIEFELAMVWKGQGFFSDIDSIMRKKGYELAKIDIESAWPVAFPHGEKEPIWGKAWYVPGIQFWLNALGRMDRTEYDVHRKKAAAIFTISNMPVRATELVGIGVEEEPDELMNSIPDKLEYAYRYQRVEQYTRGLFSPVTQVFNSIKSRIMKL